jgi:hypothetical protein
LRPARLRVPLLVAAVGAVALVVLVLWGGALVPASADGPTATPSVSPQVPTSAPDDDRQDPSSPAPAPQPQRGLYAPDSPWNTRIPADATIDPRSRELVGSLREAADEEGFVLALRRWTVPVYFADAGTPREDVSLTAPWTEYRRLSGVPIPPGARPDPQDDGHLTVIDRERGCEYDLWQARQDPDGGWSASWGNAVRIGGSGAYQGGIAARGSGFASAAGLVWPEELSRGRIDHALVFSYPHPKDGGPVAPATASDGNSTRPDAIPEGARVQLDPALDLDRLGLSDETKIIARALQTYGMILGDNGGALSLYAAHPFGFSSDPWQSIWPSGSFADLSKIPAERFRVLALGPQQPRERFGLEADGCADISR